MIPAIWLAVRSVIYSQIKLFFGFKYVRIFTFSRSCHFYSKSHHFRSILQHFYYMNKMRCKSLFCFRFSNQLLDQMNIGTERILRFQKGCYSDKDVFVLRVTQFWFDIRHILVILNPATSAGRSSDFKITWPDQIARHEVQLRSTFIWYIYLFSTELLSGEITMTNGTAYVQ